MLTQRSGVPRFLLILLGPMLFATGRAAAESQGEETAGLLWLPAAAAIIRNLLTGGKVDAGMVNLKPG